jgi:hypothetical protein
LGLVALQEIEDSQGAERGAGLAKWAIGLGFIGFVMFVLLLVGIARAAA